MDKFKDNTAYKYIKKDGNILTGNDGLTEKVKTEANKIIEKVKSKLTDQKDANEEKEKDDNEDKNDLFQEIKDAIVKTFKHGPLIWKPHMENTRSKRSECKVINEDQLSDKDVVYAFDWNDGFKTRLSIGKYHVEGEAGGYFNTGIEGSAHEISTESHDKNDQFKKHTSEYEGRAYLNSEGKCGFDSDIVGYKACASAQANCNLRTKGKLSHNNLKDSKSKDGVNTCHRIYHKINAEGDLTAEANITASAIAGKRFNACKNISAKAKGKTTFCLADVRTTKRPGSVEGKATLFDLDAEGDAEVKIFGRKASAKAKTDCHLNVQGKASYAKVRELKSTEGTYHKKYYSANVEGEIEGEANFKASAEAGKHSASIDLNIKGKAKAKADFQLAQVSSEKGRHDLKVLNLDAKGEAELLGSCKINGKTQTMKAKAEGQAHISGVDVKADLSLKKHKEGFSCKGVHLEIGKVHAEGKASFQLNERTPKEVSGQASVKAVSLHCLHVDTRKTEHTDDPDMTYKAGLLNANALNAKIVGKKTGKKTTVSVDNTLATLNMGNVSVTGVDNRENNLTNKRMKAQTSSTVFGVETTPGIDLFNFRAGINRETGCKISNRKSYFNVDLSIGLPKLNFNVSGGGFNIGIPFFGGGGSGGDEGFKTTDADNTDDDNTKNSSSKRDGNETHGKGGSGGGVGCKKTDANYTDDDNNTMKDRYSSSRGDCNEKHDKGGSGGVEGCKKTDGNYTNNDNTKKDRYTSSKVDGNQTPRCNNVPGNVEYYGKTVINGSGDENVPLRLGNYNESFPYNDGQSQVGFRRSDIYTACSSSNPGAQRNETLDYKYAKFDDDGEEMRYCSSKYDKYFKDTILTEEDQLDLNCVRMSNGDDVNNYSTGVQENKQPFGTIDCSGRSSGIVNDAHEDVMIDDSGQSNKENIECYQITDDIDTNTGNYDNFTVYGDEAEMSGNRKISSNVGCDSGFLFSGHSCYSDKGSSVVNTNGSNYKVDTEGSGRHRLSYDKSRCDESKIPNHDQYVKSKVGNLSDPSEFNKYMSMLVVEGVNPNYESNKKHVKHNKQENASNHFSYWNNIKEVERDLLHMFAPSTDNPGQSSTSESHLQEKPQKRCKQSPKKPFGANKNIHTIFTMDGTDTKEIIQKGNIACFKDDE